MGLPLVYAVLMLFYITTNASILIDAGWENGTFNDYYFNVSKNDYGAILVDGPTTGAPTCTGTKSVKHELTFGKGSVWSQLVLNMDPFNSFANGKEHWFAFAVYLSTDWLPDPGYEDLIWELHGRPDTEDGEFSRTATVAIRTLGDQWLITYTKDSKDVTVKGSYEETGYKTVGKFETGKWTVFVINTLYDYNPNGYLKIWKDGALVIDKTNGIGFKDKKGPFVKMGVYKGVWDLSKSWAGPTAVSSRTLYIDDFRVGDASTTYADIVPNCNNNSAPITLSPPTGLILQLK